MSVDPAQVHTLPELAAAFDALRGRQSYADLKRAAYALPPREGRRPALPSSTVSDLLGGSRCPRATRL